MEHAFDTLSKSIAQTTISRREAMATLLRGAAGALLMSMGFVKSSRAQSGACAACGSCATLDVGLNTITTTCRQSCEAQTLCDAAQKLAPYQLLTSTLTFLGFRPSTYDALLSIQSSGSTRFFHTTYLDPVFSSNTADLFVVWAPNKQVSAFAIQYQNGSPIWGYIVNGSSVEQVVPPAPSPPPFMLSDSPSSISVADGTSATTMISSTVASGFSSAIELSASGLPTGATASFRPRTIVAPGSGSSIMTIHASATTPAGVYPITVTGAVKAFTETTTLSLTVDPSGGVALLGLPDSRGGVDPPHVGAYREEADTSAVSGNYCPVTCAVVEGAVGLGSMSICADVAGAVVTGGCLELGPLAAPCLVAGFLASSVLTSACVKGAKAVANWACMQFCSCPPCTHPGTTLTCEADCNSTNCKPPATCSAQGCICSTACGPGTSACGEVCCATNSYTCCNGICVAGVGNTCCESAGESCFPGSFCCGPTCCPDSDQCCGDYCCSADEVCSCANGGHCCSPT
jgi:hypothetical protein